LIQSRKNATDKTVSVVVAVATEEEDVIIIEDEMTVVGTIKTNPKEINRTEKTTSKKQKKVVVQKARKLLQRKNSQLANVVDLLIIDVKRKMVNAKIIAIAVMEKIITAIRKIAIKRTNLNLLRK